MNRWIVVALLAGATLAHGQASTVKKELVAKLLQMQQPGIDNLSRGLVERPAMQMTQEAARVLQTQVPADKREAIGKTIEANVKKFVDESAPLMRERAFKLAPSTLGTTMEEKFSEDELRQLISWFDSPLSKKYSQAMPEMQDAFVRKLLAEAEPVIDPKLQTLEQSIRTALSQGAAAAPNAKSAKATNPPSKAASK